MVKDIIKGIVGYKLIETAAYAGVLLIVALIAFIGKMMFKGIRNMQKRLWSEKEEEK